MTDYREMYLTMMRASEKALRQAEESARLLAEALRQTEEASRLLVEAQQQCEELYLAAEEDDAEETAHE